MAVTEPETPPIITPQSYARYEQTFPTLTPPEIDADAPVRRGARYADGEALFETGKPGPACS